MIPTIHVQREDFDTADEIAAIAADRADIGARAHLDDHLAGDDLLLALRRGARGRVEGGLPAGLHRRITTGRGERDGREQRAATSHREHGASGRGEGPLQYHPGGGRD